MIKSIELKNEMLTAAREAGQAYLDKHYGGRDEGACGFAWVTITPQHDGRTRAGKDERAVYRKLGFDLDWTGKTFQLWNPSGLGCQNVDAKHDGAIAAAKVLTNAGLQAHAASRLD